MHYLTRRRHSICCRARLGRTATRRCGGRITLRWVSLQDWHLQVAALSPSREGRTKDLDASRIWQELRPHLLECSRNLWFRKRDYAHRTLALNPLNTALLLKFDDYTPTIPHLHSRCQLFSAQRAQLVVVWRCVLNFIWHVNWESGLRAREGAVWGCSFVNGIPMEGTSLLEYYSINQLYIKVLLG